MHAFSVAPMTTRIRSATTSSIMTPSTLYNKYFVDDDVNVQDDKVSMKESPPVNEEKGVQVARQEGTESEEETTEPLSDLDARVLKAMLQEDKLDLSQEANMRKLLERGVAPKSAPIPETKQGQEESDSVYASTLFKVSELCLECKTFMIVSCAHVLSTNIM